MGRLKIFKLRSCLNIVYKIKKAHPNKLDKLFSDTIFSFFSLQIPA